MSESCQVTVNTTPKKFTMLFGKYKGEALEDVWNKDHAYLNWIKQQPNMSETLVKAINKLYLKSCNEYKEDKKQLIKKQNERKLKEANSDSE
jgi:uncharacterized protein (DUF3820 family)